MSIKEMDEAYSNLKTEYFSIQDELTTERQCIDCYKRDILKLQKQLKIAVDILEVISTHTCFCDEDVKEQVSIVYAWSSEALEQIEGLDK